jgi:hypothetical protein
MSQEERNRRSSALPTEPAGARKPLTPSRFTPYATAAVAPQGVSVFYEPDVSNPARLICFRISLVLVFLQFSMLHQTLAGLVGVNFHLMYVFGLPPLIGVVMAGGLPRAMSGRQALYWCGFAVWMVVCLPFSTWKGGSIPIVIDYLRTDLPMLFIVAGLALTWKECQSLISAVALGSIVDLLTARFIQGADDYGGRLGLQAGTVANPNDFAGHLILALSFLLCIGLSSKSVLKRAIALIGVGVGMVMILKTASRGAEVGLGFACLVFFIYGTARQRVVLAAMLPVALAALLLLLPPETLQRLQSFSANGETKTNEALESTASRQYLLRMSLVYTLRFPIFGLGPGQFATYEGSNNVIEGMTHGSWHETHNSYTQASSEGGIPLGLLFIGGAFSTIWAFAKVRREAKKRADCKDIETAAFCVLVGACGFYVAIAFLSFAYFFYEPFLAGLAIALSRAAKHEFQVRSQQGQLAAAGPGLIAGGFMPSRRQPQKSAYSPGEFSGVVKQGRTVTPGKNRFSEGRASRQSD